MGDFDLMGFLSKPIFKIDGFTFTVSVVLIIVILAWMFFSLRKK